MRTQLPFGSPSESRSSHYEDLTRDLLRILHRAIERPCADLRDLKRALRDVVTEEDRARTSKLYG